MNLMSVRMMVVAAEENSSKGKSAECGDVLCGNGRTGIKDPCRWKGKRCLWLEPGR